MITRRMMLSIVAIVILTSIVVYSADAAGIPKKAISIVSRFIESDLPTTTLFTDVQNTITSIQQFTTTSAVFENPAKTFGTTLSGGAVAANRTLNLPAITGTDTLATLGLAQSWTSNQDFGISGATDKFDGTGIIIRNPAHTFTTTLSNPAITANRTLNLPLTTATDTLDALGTAGTWTGNHQFTTTSSLYENPAKTFATTLAGGAVAANRTLNLPAITGTDTLATLGLAQSWTSNQDFGISGATDKFDGTGIIIRNPAHTFTTTLSNPAITANRTLNLPLLNATGTIGVLNGNPQTWTGNNTMKFGSGGIIVRNPASTFATTFIGPSVLSNQTVILTGSPVTNFTTGQLLGNASKTTSVTRTMLGNYATLTPQITGKILVTVTGLAHASTAAAGCVIDIRANTANMGANGAALTGTLLGSNMKITSPTAYANMTFAKSVVITGLTPGTKEFFDLSYARLGASGLCTLTNVDWLLQEY